MSVVGCGCSWARTTTLFLLIITTVGALNTRNMNPPQQGGGGGTSSTIANLFRNGKSHNGFTIIRSDTTARSYVKTTFDFGNADQLVPQPLGPKTHPASMLDYATERQLKKFVDGRWKRQAPEKSAGEKVLGRKYMIDPYGDPPEKNFALQHRPVKRIFEDEIEDDEWRLYMGLSVGDQMAHRSYKIDPHTEHFQTKKAHADEMFKPQKFKYYAMLGLDNLASQTEIKNAYRRLVKLYHPDANPSEDTMEQYNLLNRAYDVLTDPVLKARYDKYGRKGLGTSAASDELKVKGKNVFKAPKKIVASYVVAKSDTGDVKWKGSHRGPPYEVAAYGTAPISERRVGDNRNQSILSASSSASTMVVSPRKPPMRDFYQILSVRRGASVDEIKCAYDVMSKRYDPDTQTSGNKVECYILYHHVQRAYEVLRNPQMRKRYDMFGLIGLQQVDTSTEPTTTSIQEDESTHSIPTSTISHLNAKSSALGMDKYPQRFLAFASTKVANAIPPPVQIGGTSSHHASRNTSIQKGLAQPFSTHNARNVFKAPPVEYRNALAPIPLDNENERFDALVMSESVPLKASSAKTPKAIRQAHSLPFPLAAENSSSQTVNNFHSVEARNAEAAAFASEETRMNSWDPLTKPQAFSRPATVGGVPSHHSTRNSSIKKDYAQPSRRYEEKLIKAPPIQYRTTIAPIPLDDENERFDALANIDSFPLKRTSTDTTIYHPMETMAVALPSAEDPSAEETTDPIPWPFRLPDAVPSTLAPVVTNDAAMNKKKAAVMSDQDKVKASRPSHQIPTNKGKMETSSQINNRNNIGASSQRLPPLAPDHTIVAPAIKKSTALIFDRDLYEVLAVKRDADTEEIRKSYNTLTKMYLAEGADQKTYIRFQEIQRAFKVLRDPAKRDEYNRNGMKGIEKALRGEKTLTPPSTSAGIGEKSKSSSSPEQLEGFPDLIAPAPVGRGIVSFNLDMDIVATKPLESSSSTISLQKYCNKKKQFKAPSIQFRSSIPPLPLPDENERFDSLSESSSVPLKSPINHN